MLRRQPKHHALSNLLALETKLKRSSLGSLMHQAEQLGAQEQRVLQALPLEIRDAFHLISLDAGLLQLQCHTAAMATRLRMRQREILHRINQTQSPPVKRIQILIRPANRAIKLSHRPLHLSKENAQALLQEAGQTRHEGLKAILEKLARHAEDST